jgi:tRNA-specific 2-thiouridylase
MIAERHQVAIALSGGVDSAVAASILLRQGYEVQGIHLRLSAAGPSSQHLAALARALGLRLTEMDFREDFARLVLDYFVSEYTRGRTPNPCVRCNAAIKFGRLWERLREAGVSRLATGHYARIQPGADGRPGLFRSLDRRKDQSYFLSRLPRDLLPHLLFPLGDLTKTEVRRQYHRLGLPPLDDCRESMELCFIPEGDYQGFIRRRRGYAGPPGELVDTRGTILGRHRGLEYYTVGQRRRLGVPAREPYYVTDIQPEVNRVVLGHRPELLSRGLRASHLNWLLEPPAGDLEATAVIRYRHPGVLARVRSLSPSEVEITFAVPQSAVAPGQAVVLYRGDQVLGGGWIEERLK